MKCRNSPRLSHGPVRAHRGVALVMTLIMLAIILVVVVVFLASAGRNRVTTTLRRDQTDAEFAAETAYQRATAEIMTNILGHMAPDGAGLIPDPSLLAVDFFVSRTNLNSGVVPTVTNLTGSIERYLDLNRNQRFEDPYNFNNRPYGDPIWLGVLDRLDRPHAANNKFVARIAYMVLPAGKALDLNTIHNAASPNNGLKFSRNQGFGPWELNFAAFLAELSPDVWWKRGSVSEYNYGPFPKPIADGMAFEDARSLVDYRNAWGRDQSPRRLSDTFPAAIINPQFPAFSIDAYADGNAGAVLGADPFLTDDDLPGKTDWPGANTTNHFYHPQELFYVTNAYTPNKVTAQFHDNLTNAIFRDPLAYYRMIAQLGTDTGSDFEDRIHLNYVDHHVAGGAVTNFVSWDSSPALGLAFFTNVAQRIFLAQSNEFNNLSTNQLPIRSITEIPIYPTNLYSTAIHRILQEAANIYDATRTNEYPSVFRPIFGTIASAPNSRYIVGFENDDRVGTLQAWINANTNGIPLVIGAKQGFPNFNEFSQRSEILVTRKLQVVRPNTNPGTRPNGTNQMYVLGVSNYFGVEAWNPYQVRKTGSGAYPRQVSITVSNYALMTLTNDLGSQITKVINALSATNFGAGTWFGGEERGFRLPLDTNVVFLSNGVYNFGNNTFANVSTNSFENLNGRFPLPYWVLTISNRMSYLMSEIPAGSYERIVDFVMLQDNQVVDLFRDLVGAQNPYDGIGGLSQAIANVWNTNRRFGTDGPTEGIRQQMDIALGNTPTANAEWRAFALTATPGENDKNRAIDAFRAFMGLTPIYGSVIATNTQLAMQAPFNPAAKLAVQSTWQANDPLVHYHVDDLRVAGAATNHQYLKPSQVATNLAPSSLGRLNDRYSPWGGNPQKSSDPNTFNRAVKDPGIYSPDDWNFPNDKLANIGLLGRIHRGTPWQTVYFKSESASLRGTSGWTNQSTDIAERRNGQIFSRTHPTNDWKLADMFTTALDERTSRGLLSINVTNLESWSALLSGVPVLQNASKAPTLGQPRQYTNVFIEPYGNNPFANSPLAQIWSNVVFFQTNQARPLQSVGDLLQVPELTVKSPFLNQAGDNYKFGLDDYAYERIPQQILSLLRGGSSQSRFVIYAYGQALKPALINPGNGQVENYQVTAEFATRTVVRVEGDPRGRLRTVVESFNILPPD